jgi:hypothetical protein
MKDKEESKKKAAPGRHENSLKNLKPIKGDTGKGFDKNPQNATKGGAPRTQNILKFITEEVGREVKPLQIRVTFGTLLDLTQAELERLTKRADDGRERIPALVAVVAKRLLHDIKNGDTDALFRIVEQIAGKPKQQIEMESSINVNALALDALAPEQLDALAAQLGAILQKPAEDGSAE